jgi:hypothetical protein
VDCPRHAFDHGEKALAAWGGFVCLGMPEAVKIVGAQAVQVLVREALSFAKILLGETVDCNRLRTGDHLGPGKTGPNDCRRALVTQPASRGSCAASPMKMSVAQQSHGRSSWP